MKVVFVLFIIMVAEVWTSQWIDPHDMNTNVKQQYIKPRLKKSLSSSSINEGSTDPLPEICYSHLRRVVSVLMNSAHIDKRDPEKYHGHIRFNVDPNEFDFLVNFGKQEFTLDHLRKLDTVFSGSFRRTYIDEYLDTIESFQLKLYSLVVNIQNLWILGMIGLLYVVWQLFKNDFSFAYILKYLLIIVITVDFGIRYQYLVEEAEEHNLGAAYSSKCDTNKMSWGDWTKYMFSTKNCEKKTVTPLDAFLYQIKNLIIIPMHAVGTGMGGFGKNMFTNLPWGVNLIMWPIMLIFTLILAVFLMTVCTGQAIEFNIFHLVKLKFGGGSHNRDNSLPVPTVERLMDKVLHRPMVQNVHVSLASGDSEKARDGDKSAPKAQISESKEPLKHPQGIVLDQNASPSSTKSEVDVISKSNSDTLQSPKNMSTNTCYQKSNTESSTESIVKDEQKTDLKSRIEEPSTIPSCVVSDE